MLPYIERYDAKAGRANTAPVRATPRYGSCSLCACMLCVRRAIHAYLCLRFLYSVYFGTIYFGKFEAVGINPPQKLQAPLTNAS
jgi:hypothetical protein